MSLEQSLGAVRVLPVITVRSVAETVSLCQALQQGGMRAVEITLRSPEALDAIRVLRAELPDILVAAGTILSESDVDAALEAGASLLLSPGATPALLRAAVDRDADFLPGVATASEVMQGLEQGFECFKLFPAVRAGGSGLLRALGGPFPAVTFCPTGGLDRNNFRDYLALDNVVCCGGSWMVAPHLLDAEDWVQVRSLAAEAMAEA